MKKWPFRILLFALLALTALGSSAKAAQIDTTFANWQASPITIGDKTFTYISGGGNFGPAKMSFIETVLPTQIVYDMDVYLEPSLIGTAITLDYSIFDTDPAANITGLGVDSLIGSLGPDFNLTKTFYTGSGHVGQEAQLTSTNGNNVGTTGNFGHLVYTSVLAVIPRDNFLTSFRDEYTQARPGGPFIGAPEPSSLVLVGFAVMGMTGMSWARRRRNLVK